MRFFFSPPQAEERVVVVVIAPPLAMMMMSPFQPALGNLAIKKNQVLNVAVLASCPLANGPINSTMLRGQAVKSAVGVRPTPPLCGAGAAQNHLAAPC